MCKIFYNTTNLTYFIYTSCVIEYFTYFHYQPDETFYWSIYTLCLKKNDNDVLRYNFNAYQPILIIFGRDIAE